MAQPLELESRRSALASLRLGGAGLVLAASALFAANGVVSKLALDAGLAPSELVQFRSACAAASFFALSALSPASTLRVRPRELAHLVVLGVIGIAMVSWLHFVGLERLPAGIALLLEFLAPVFVVLWVRFARGEQVRARMWWALVLCVGGLTLVARIGLGGGLDGVGVLASIAAAVALAVYDLMTGSAVAVRDPISVLAWTFATAAAFWLVASPPWRFPWHLLGDTTGAPEPLGFGVPVWALLAWIVVLSRVCQHPAAGGDDAIHRRRQDQGRRR